jgi:hypothetical protein
MAGIASDEFLAMQSLLFRKSGLSFSANLSRLKIRLDLPNYDS